MKLNDEYKSKLEEVVTECTVKDQAILDRNSKLEDMRKIVSRLTATNNDMLGILSSKVRLEESFKTLETANRNLMQVRYICNENGPHFEENGVPCRSL